MRFVETGACVLCKYPAFCLIKADTWQGIPPGTWTIRAISFRLLEHLDQADERFFRDCIVRGGTWPFIGIRRDLRGLRLVRIRDLSLCGAGARAFPIQF